MLDAGAKLLAEVEKAAPRNDWARQNEESMLGMTLPEDNSDECCYFLKLKRPEVSLINSKLNTRFTLTYSGETLPHFVEWKSMVSGDYALGLEPCTTELDVSGVGAPQLAKSIDKQISTDIKAIIFFIVSSFYSADLDCAKSHCQISAFSLAYVHTLWP